MLRIAQHLRHLVQNAVFAQAGRGMVELIGQLERFLPAFAGRAFLSSAMSDSGVSFSCVISTTVHKSIAIPTAMISGNTNSPKKVFVFRWEWASFRP